MEKQREAHHNHHKLMMIIMMMMMMMTDQITLQGSGHELYGGFPGYSPMLFNGSPMEQAMPATGLGLGPGNISPGSHHGANHGMESQGLPPHYNGSYHPGYLQQNLQVRPTPPFLTKETANMAGIFHQKFNLFGI